MKLPRPISTQPIPEHAEKVFSGILFDVYQWEQEQFDGSTATFEKLTRPDTVVVFAVTEDQQVVLTKQEQPGKAPFIGAAGGRVDEGETPLKAAKRELLEETGYEAQEYTLWDARHPTSKIDWVVYTFIATGAKKVNETALDAGEKVTLKLVDFDTFLDIGTQQNFSEREIVPELYEAKLDPQKKTQLAGKFGIFT